MSTPRLRAADVTDLPFVTACARAAYAPYVPRIGREPAPMVADFARHFEDGELHIIETDGAIGYSVHRITDGALFIDNIAIEPSHQGGGTGRTVFALLEEQARCAGVTQLQLYTNEKMREALAFYEHLGFTITERRIEDGFHRVYLMKAV